MTITIFCNVLACISLPGSAHFLNARREFIKIYVGFVFAINENQKDLDENSVSALL
jgi:hypothetical protein